MPGGRLARTFAQASTAFIGAAAMDQAVAGRMRRPDLVPPSRARAGSTIHTLPADYGRLPALKHEDLVERRTASYASTVTVDWLRRWPPDAVWLHGR